MTNVQADLCSHFSCRRIAWRRSLRAHQVGADRSEFCPLGDTGTGEADRSCLSARRRQGKRVGPDRLREIRSRDPDGHAARSRTVPARRDLARRSVRRRNGAKKNSPPTVICRLRRISPAAATRPSSSPVADSPRRRARIKRAMAARTPPDWLSRSAPATAASTMRRSSRRLRPIRMSMAPRWSLPASPAEDLQPARLPRIRRRG